MFFSVIDETWDVFCVCLPLVREAIPLVDSFQASGMWRALSKRKCEDTALRDFESATSTTQQRFLMCCHWILGARAWSRPHPPKIIPQNRRGPHNAGVRPRSMMVALVCSYRYLGCLGLHGGVVDPRKQTPGFIHGKCEVAASLGPATKRRPEESE
jgi:hypothetical protein